MELFSKPDNYLIYEKNEERRSELSTSIVKQLLAEGWTVFVFGGVYSYKYTNEIPALNPYYIRSYIPHEEKEYKEIADAQRIQKKIAVILHGLLTPDGVVINKLLANPEIMVLAVSAVRTVRGDHRYNHVWAGGKWFKPIARKTRKTSKQQALRPDLVTTDMLTTAMSLSVPVITITPAAADDFEKIDNVIMIEETTSNTWGTWFSSFLGL